MVSAYSKGYWVAVPEGSVAALPWIPVQNRQGREFGQIANYGAIINPVDNVQYAVHTYMEGANGSALGGYTQDVKIETEISLDIAYEYAPLSTASETPLLAFALV